MHQQKTQKLPTSTDSSYWMPIQGKNWDRVAVTISVLHDFGLHKFQLKETLSAYNVERLSEFKFLSSLSAT